MAQVKIVGVVVIALVLAALILQNTEPVETRFLFGSVTMPRAALLAMTGLGGFILGVLVAFRLTRNQRSHGDRPREAP